MINYLWQVPRVGVAVLVIRNNKELLVGRRLGEHGKDMYAVPGGHVEPGETPIEAAARELKEETGIDLPWTAFREPADPSPGWTFTKFRKSGKTYVTLYFVAYVVSSTVAVVKEPDKCAGWEWYPKEELPQPLFAPLQQFFDVERRNRERGECKRIV